jgi:hypothetical protein
VPDRALMTVLLTDRIDDAARFLAEVVGMGEPRWFPSSGALGARLFGWPSVPEDARRAVFGSAPGLVELVEIPDSLRDVVEPGVGFVGFATPDVEARTDAAAAASFPPGERLDAEATTVVPVRAGGLPFAFLRFEEA